MILTNERKLDLKPELKIEKIGNDSYAREGTINDRLTFHDSLIS